MNAGKAFFDTNVVLYMYAVIMFRVFLFVTALAVNFTDLDFTSHMLGKVRNLHVTTGTGIFAMDRCGKSRSRNLVAVAAKTGGRVDSHPLLSPHRLCDGYEQ